MNDMRELAREVDFVYVTYADLHGITRGKLLSSQTYRSIADNGMRNCCGVFSKDVTGAPVEETGILWEHGADDNYIRPCVATLRPAPWKPGCAMVIADVFEPDGTPLALSPREALKSAVDRLRAVSGAEPVAGVELEFSLLDADGVFLSKGTQAYSVHQMTRAANVLDRLSEALTECAIPVDGISAENSDGQYEISLRHAGALEMTDALFQTRHVIREVAQRAGCRATFMALPRNGVSPNGLHVNVSLAGCDGFGIGADGVLGAALAGAISGILAGADDLLPLFLPTINAFKAPYAQTFFPRTASWGFDNRSVLVRVPDTSASGCRLEFRLPTSDANPYLAMAGTLLLMARGLENGSATGMLPAVVGNGFEQAGLPPLDFRFEPAIDRLATQDWLRAEVGDRLVDTFVAVKRREVAHHRRHVSDWESNVYGALF